MALALPTWSSRTKDRALLGVILVITLARGLLWIGLYPALKITDETSHFDNIQYRAENNMRSPLQTGPLAKVMNPTASTELRTVWKATNHFWRDSFLRYKHITPDEHDLEDLAHKRENRLTSGQNSSMLYPPVYYAAAVPVYSAFRTRSVLVRLFALRVYSLLWGLIFVACTFLAARHAFESRVLAFVAAMFVVLQPMAAQQMIAINNDIAVAALCAAAFVLQLRWLRVLPALPSPSMLAGLGCVLALAIQTKPQGYGLLPGTLLLLGISLWKGPRNRALVTALAIVLAAYVVTTAVCTLLLDRHTAVAAVDAATTTVLTPPRPPHAPDVPLVDFVNLLPQVDEKFLDYVFVTAWGTFCWLDVALASPWFDALRTAAPLFWLGLGAAIARRLLRPAGRFAWDLRVGAFSAFTACVGLAFMVAAEYYARETMLLHHAIQGRALLFVAPAFAIVGVTAVTSLVPRRLHSLLAAFLFLGLVLLALGSITTVVRYEYVG